MRDITLILLAAGKATRFGLPVRKQWLYQGSKPLWQSVADRFRALDTFALISIVGAPDEVPIMKRIGKDRFVTGGNSRQESLRNALQDVQTPYVLVSDVARCCVDPAMIHRIVARKKEADCIVPALDVSDTLYRGETPVDRGEYRIVQTPQLSRTDLLRRALDAGEFTDESSAVRAIGGRLLFVEGSPLARKLTTAEDLALLPCLGKPDPRTWSGTGIDTHAFEAGKSMMLGGVPIDAPMGFKAHSDGDVAIHALIDALLGAAGLGDIGELFPDTDERYRGIDSALLLERVTARIRAIGLDIVHVDLSVVAQTPKLHSYKEAIRRRLSELLGISPARCNIKATTSEGLGFIGRAEGVTVHASATLSYFDWSSRR